MCQRRINNYHVKKNINQLTYAIHQFRKRFLYMKKSIFHRYNQLWLCQIERKFRVFDKMSYYILISFFETFVKIKIKAKIWLIEKWFCFREYEMSLTTIIIEYKNFDNHVNFRYISWFIIFMFLMKYESALEIFLLRKR